MVVGKFTECEREGKRNDECVKGWLHKKESKKICHHFLYLIIWSFSSMQYVWSSLISSSWGVFSAIVRAARSNLLFVLFTLIVGMSPRKQSEGDNGMWQPMKRESDYWMCGARWHQHSYLDCFVCNANRFLMRIPFWAFLFIFFCPVNYVEYEL